MPRLRAVFLSWNYQPDAARVRWDIVGWRGAIPPAERGGDPGVCLAHACADARSVTVQVEEGDWWIAAVAVGPGGIRLIPAADGMARVILNGMVDPHVSIPAPANVSVATAAAELSTVLQVDPKVSGDGTRRLEVIEGPTVDQGFRVAELPAPSNEFGDSEMGMRTTGIPFPLEGHGSTEDRKLFVRGIDAEGRRGTSSPVLTLRPARQGYESLGVCSIEGTSLTGFTAPGAGDGWETDGTDGIRLRELPTGATGGSWPKTLTDPIPAICRYVPEVTITSNEKDFGHKLLFVLDAWVQARRKSATAVSVPARECSWPGIPELAPDLEGTKFGPYWLARLIDGNGKCREPLPPPLWEVRYGDATPLGGSWEPLVPGRFLTGRYVQVRVTLKEQTGYYQVIAPKLLVKAWVPRRIVTGSDQCTGGVATKQVSLANDIHTAASPFQNSMSVFVQSKTQDQLCYVTAKAPATNPATFTVTHRTLGAATPGAATDFDYLVIGW